MLSQIPSRTLETAEPCARSFVALCFHILTNCFSRLPAGLLAGKPFVLTTIRIAPGCGRQIRELPPFFSVRSVSRWQIHSFHTIANSLSSRKKSSALESRTSGLFCKNTRGGGVSIHDKLVSRSRSPWSSQPRDVSVRRFSPSHEQSRRSSSGTTTYTRQPYASLCAARRSTCRASPSVAHVLSLSSPLRVLPLREAYVSKSLCRERAVGARAAAQKGTTKP